MIRGAYVSTFFFLLSFIYSLLLFFSATFLYLFHILGACHPASPCQLYLNILDDVQVTKPTNNVLKIEKKMTTAEFSKKKVENVYKQDIS